MIFGSFEGVQRATTTTIFVVDASGSSALNRLAEAKGAVELLLAECYVRRDRVALVAFHGQHAELVLPPTRSLVRARRSLAGLPGGGGTPWRLVWTWVAPSPTRFVVRVTPAPGRLNGWPRQYRSGSSRLGARALKRTPCWQPGVGARRVMPPCWSTPLRAVIRQPRRSHWPWVRSFCRSPMPIFRPFERGQSDRLRNAGGRASS
jgi:hypothetical protein